jgi:hypothetical protein
MLNHFILEVVETFQPEELEEFDLFLKSPYHNRSFNADKLQKLFAKVWHAKKKGTLHKLSKEALFSHLFPDSPMVAGKLDKLMTELKKLLHGFLEIHKFEAPEHEGKRLLFLMQDFRERGLEERYGQTWEKAKKLAFGEGIETLENFHFKLSVDLEFHEWESTFNKAKGDLFIPSILESLDKYYFVERTNMLNLLMLQQKLTVLPDQSLKVLDAPWHVPAEHLEKGGFLAVSWKIYGLLRQTDPEVRQFEELLELLKNNESKIGYWHLSGFYAHLRNICTFLIDNGHYELRETYFKIILDNLERGYFYFNGKIPSNALLNIIQTALFVNQIDWANQFVEAHRSRIIDENETQDFYRMNKALCLFAEGRFEETLECIPHGSTYSFYHLMAKRLELKCYYELDSELLPYKIDAFKMFISRAGNKILSEKLHELFVNFINFLRQLSMIPRFGDKAKSVKLIARIHEKKLVAERPWLLEKAHELG